jgi:hypothetical protein
MEAAKYLPGECQLLAMFLDKLPTNLVSFITLYDNVMNSLNDNTALPNIQHLFKHTIHIENNILRTHLLNLNPCSYLTTSTPLLPNSKVPANPPTLPTNGTPKCRNCGHRHPTDKCFQPGGTIKGKRKEVLTNRSVWPQAYLAKIYEEVELEGEDKPDNKNILISKFSTMSFNQTNKIDFSTYAMFFITTTLEDIPLALASLSQTFNSALDLACTNHIIRDHSLFHQYDPDGGVPVKTANCGFPETLAVGFIW